ncbi:hypothetical protein PanWU01x14_002100 [Parasponia andersonii]|uniref:Uncharacterized protein n=1 Tax=Parasponia andersonii TaxID=3476 RepID=A0A2P5E535_PARAD|nr:hypothetical protein PanWU01x14_002100 [Parasponia andersonii]
MRDTIDRRVDPVTGIWPSEEVSLSTSDSSTQSAPPRIDKILIADKVLGVRKRYRRGVGPKLKQATSTSFTTASPP